MSEERKTTPVALWIIGGLLAGIGAVVAVAILLLAIKFSQSTTVVEEVGPNHMRARTTVGGEKK